MKYKAFYNSKTAIIEAESSYGAQVKAIELFRPSKSNKHMVHVHLIEDDQNNPVIHTAVN